MLLNNKAIRTVAAKEFKSEPEGTKGGRLYKVIVPLKYEFYDLYPLHEKRFAFELQKIHIDL